MIRLKRDVMALVREAGADRDLGQTELAVCSQELLCPLNAAVDHVLVRISAARLFPLQMRPGC